mgnify:CR=1 FL=1
MFDDDNRGLINWFHILLYQIPAQEFLEIIGNAISEDASKVRKATTRFEEIMKEAQTMKGEFEDYQEEEGIERVEWKNVQKLEDVVGNTYQSIIEVLNNSVKA